MKTTSDGFTVVEMVVTLAVMSLFLTMFFQIFNTNQSQQVAVAQRAAAYNVAASNLDKISSKAGFYSGSLCTPSGWRFASGDFSDARARGPVISALNTIQPEGLTGLPSNTTQEMYVEYPRGCGDPDMPVTIISIVDYGTGSVKRAKFVN